jgi:hypothetical protein
VCAREARSGWSHVCGGNAPPPLGSSVPLAIWVEHRAIVSAMSTPESTTLEDDLRILATATTYDVQRALDRVLPAVAWPNGTPLPEDLTPDQRRVAEVLATRSGIPGLSSVAIPYQVQFRRRWLGIDPPGALERRHPFTHRGTTHSWPLWRIWQVAGDKPKRQQGVSAVVADVVEILDAYIDALIWSPYENLDESEIQDHIARLGADGGDWATRRLHEALGWHVTETSGKGIRWIKVNVEDYGFATSEPGSLEMASSAQLALFVALARAGRGVEPAWERWFPLFAHPFLREIAAALPDDRREAILLAAADRGISKDSLFGIFRLWPRYPYPALARWVDDLLRLPARETGFDPAGLRTWKVDWKELLAKTPAGAFPKSKAATKTATKTATKATTKGAPATKKNAAASESQPVATRKSPSRTVPAATATGRANAPIAVEKSTRKATSKGVPKKASPG